MEALQGEILERTGLLETLEKDIEKVAKLIGKSTQNLQAVAGGKTSKVIGELQINLDEIRRILHRTSQFSFINCQIRCNEN